MRVLAVIPAYNEEDCIQNTVAGLVATCPDVDYVVINDGSKDRTESICQEQGINHVELPINTGLTSGFKTGMKYAQRHGYDAVVQFDADGQHLPQYIPVMAQAMQEQNADIVIASRTENGESPVGARGIGSRLISWLIKATTGTTIGDPTSGMRMYNRRLIEDFATGFDLSPEPDTVAMLARKGAKVIEVPAHMEERQGGQSYLDLPNIVRYMLRTCFSILMFQWFR
ncbi:MAG: glycosyltransferase family 2 protein [Coriobacteriales bacterium]|nr:glycosyltransferase family 2 protein [Coriobacteriales bacterium]